MFKVKISAFDSCCGGIIDDANATFNIESKDEVNTFIDRVNKFNKGNDSDHSVIELMEAMFDTWYGANCDLYDSYDDARDYWDDGLGYSMRWRLNIDVFDDDGNNLIIDDYEYDIPHV